MMIKDLHPWEVSPKEAVGIQTSLRERVRLTPLASPPSTVAGVDVSYDRGSDHFFAAVVVMTFPELHVVEETSEEGRVTFPYVPGLLSFREGPVVLKALRKLDAVPDVIIFDGQGIAHPRGLGIASHMGLFLGIPTVGCAKTKLCGFYDEPGMERGDYSPLILNGKQVGVVLRTKRGVKPLFVSPGHLIDVRGGLEIVLSCCRRYRLPEPTRQAHLLVNRVRRRE